MQNAYCGLTYFILVSTYLSKTYVFYECELNFVFLFFIKFIKTAINFFVHILQFYKYLNINVPVVFHVKRAANVGATDVLFTI